MSERHQDIFNRDEAAAYLHLSSPNTLDTLRDKGQLVGFLMGKEMFYHRDDLNNCIVRVSGRAEAVPAGVKPLRLAGGKA